MRSVLRQPAVDDHGREYVPVVLAEMALRAEGAADRDSARSLQWTLRGIVIEETRRWSLARALTTIAFGIAVMVFVYALLTLFGASVIGPPLVLAAVLTTVALALADRAITRRRISAGIGATIVAHGMCARCGYSLRGLEPHEDGRLVCPECGGAWLPGRITRPHWGAQRHPLAPRPDLRLRAIFLRPPIITDDRAMLCRRLDSWLLSVSGARRQAIGRERVRALRAAIRRPTLWIRAMLAGLLLIPLVWLLTNTPAAATQPERAAQWLAWIAGLLIVCIAVGTSLSGEIGIRTRQLVGACVGDSLCASCASDLAAPDAEGFRVCPACGASWKAIYRAEPPRPARVGS